MRWRGEVPERPVSTSRAPFGAQFPEQWGVFELYVEHGEQAQ